MPASADGVTGYTYLTSVSGAAVTALVADGPGRMYSLEPRHWLEYACRVTGRDLTQDEWSSYLGERAYERTCPDSE
jgi:hypothetical protein